MTGGGGFLGTEICRQLLERGDQVVAYQRSRAKHIERLGGESFQGSLLDMDSLYSALHGCEAVIHTAGKAGLWGPYEEYHAVNVAGTENVIDACRQHAIDWLVHTSSPSVVHGGGDIENGNESLPYPSHFLAPYPETKAVGERLVRAADDDSLRTTSLRPHLIWGPGDPHLLPRLADKARRGVLRLPAPDKLIDTTCVENAALAHLQALDELQGQARCAGRAYFISNGEPLPQGEIIQKLLAAIGIEVTIRPVPPALAKAAGAIAETTWKLLKLKGEPPVTRWSADQLSTAHWYDLAAARQNFGYAPRVTIDEGLRSLAAFHDH